ncbi:hypothetical protein NKH77_36275 [Streptomyces sp. M19]
MPLGHGWSGLFATDTTRLGDSGTAGRPRPCCWAARRAGGAAKPAGHHHDHAEGRHPRRPGHPPGVRPYRGRHRARRRRALELRGAPRRVRLARLAGAAGRRGRVQAAVRRGRHLRRVPPGRKTALSTVRETARGHAPREVCVAGIRDGRPRYRLEAFYGPYAEDARAQYTRDYDYENVTPAEEDAGRLGESAYWASADCPGGVERALYMVTVDGAAQERAAARTWSTSGPR